GGPGGRDLPGPERDGPAGRRAVRARQGSSRGVRGEQARGREGQGLAALARGSMLDLRAIREDPERFRAGLARRGAAAHLDRLLELDAERRSLQARVEELRAEQNRISRETGRAGPDEREKLLEAGRRVAAGLQSVGPDVGRTAGHLDT